jgi:mono/diheme cytochrome c family protein
MTRTKSRLVPVLFGLLVVVLGGSLQVIFFRSPYTHANLTTSYDSAYSRTHEIVVGSPVPLAPSGLAGKPGSSADQVALGRQLFFAKFCASCHGERGQGATFAPPIAGFDLETLTQRVRVGPGAMPAFSAEAVSAEDLAAIEAYLVSVVPKR